jgi:hypothetical protein
VGGNAGEDVGEDVGGDRLDFGRELPKNRIHPVKKAAGGQV